MGSDIKWIILNSSVNVPHSAHWGWASASMGNSEDEDSETLPISWTDWWPKLADLINCFVLLDPLLSSHIAAFVTNVSHHLQLAQRPHPILVGDDLACIIHAFITSWLEYSCVVNLSMTPTALRKLQLIEKAGTHLHRHAGYRGSTKPPYRCFPWNFSSSSNSFSTIKKTDCNSAMKFVITRSALLLRTVHCKWDKAYLSELVVQTET